MHRFEWAEAEEGQEARRKAWTAAQLEEAQFAPLDLQYIASRCVCVAGCVAVWLCVYLSICMPCLRSAS